MPPGEVDKPTSKDGFLKSGYLKRYDLYDDDGLPSKIPVLNAQNMKPGYAVIFDVIAAKLSENGNTYFVPVALIRDKVAEEEWDKEWDKADNETNNIKVKENAIILNVSNEENWKNKVKNKVDELRQRKEKLIKEKETGLLNQL